MASGQYHWRLGEGSNLGGSLAADVPVYADLLAKAGYVTGYARKGAAPSENRHRQTDPFGARYKGIQEFMTERDSGRPFCFWYGAGEPHRPYDWQASIRAGVNLDAISIPPGLPDHPTVRADLGDYYLRVARLDRFAGEILTLLENAGELENTIVVMTGDNGMPFPRSKATLYDGGTRVPLAIRWGDEVKRGHHSADFVSLTDLAPTFLEAAGLPIPKSMTGRSLLRQLRGETEPARTFALSGMEQHVYPWPSRAIRTADYLYIRNFHPALWPTGATNESPEVDFRATPWPAFAGAFSYNIDPSPTKQWMLQNPTVEASQRVFAQRPREELYDLKTDPGQLVNRASDPAYAEARSRLSDQLVQELRASGDPRFARPDHASFTLHGWSIHLHDSLWSANSAKTAHALGILEAQLKRVVDVVPKSALAHLRTVPIWINPPYPDRGPTAEYHPEKGWLERNGRNPAMAKAVEITNFSIFPLENRRMPYLLLHELAHAYHDQVLGFDDPDIRATYNAAKRSGTYDKVQRFNGKSTVIDKAYAMTDAKEYFAESTEAFFGKNDFFPFTREELKQHDPAMATLVRDLWNRP